MRLTITIVALCVLGSCVSSRSGPGEVDELVAVEIGGVRQWVAAHGDHADLPVLLWHSWGTQIAMVAAHRNPDDYVGCIGVNQVVDGDHGEQVTFAKMLDLGPSADVPCFFITGEEDYNTPAGLVAQLVDELNAPRAELIVFEGAAHTPFFADPQRSLFDKRPIRESILTE